MLQYLYGSTPHLTQFYHHESTTYTPRFVPVNAHINTTFCNTLNCNRFSYMFSTRVGSSFIINMNHCFFRLTLFMSKKKIFIFVDINQYIALLTL